VLSAWGTEPKAASAAPFDVDGLGVALCGRHELYVMSLAGLLSHRGIDVRVLDSPEDALTDAGGRSIRILLLESPLPAELRSAVVGWPVVIVLVDDYPDQVGDALALGAHAVLRKNASLADLWRALHTAAERRSEPAVPLTRRQREVLRLLTDGLDNAQIALQLGISQRTARAHVSSVLERLGVDNRTQAAVTAVRNGWIR
jgi:DNA-binding NarL/FixJ family response regulator